MIQVTALVTGTLGRPYRFRLAGDLHFNRGAETPIWQCPRLQVSLQPKVNRQPDQTSTRVARRRGETGTTSEVPARHSRFLSDR